MEAFLIELWGDLPTWGKIVLGLLIFFSKEVLFILKRKPSKKQIEKIIQATEDHIIRRIELKQEGLKEQMAYANREFTNYISEIVERYSQDIRSIPDTTMKKLLIDKFRYLLKDAFHSMNDILESEFRTTELYLLENGKFQDYVHKHTQQLFNITLNYVKDFYDENLMQVPFDKIKNRVDFNRVLVLGNEVYTKARTIAKETYNKIETLKELFDRENL